VYRHQDPAFLSEKPAHGASYFVCHFFASIFLRVIISLGDGEHDVSERKEYRQGNRKCGDAANDKVLY